MLKYDRNYQYNTQGTKDATRIYCRTDTSNISISHQP